MMDSKDRFIELVSEQEWTAMLDWIDDPGLEHLTRWMQAEQTRPGNCDSKWFEDTISDLQNELKRRNDLDQVAKLANKGN